jgi:hypothetical protein
MGNFMYETSICSLSFCELKLYSGVPIHVQLKSNDIWRLLEATSRSKNNCYTHLYKMTMAWPIDYCLTNLTTIPHLLLQWPFKNFMHWQQMLWQRYVTSCLKLVHTNSSMMLYLTLFSNIIMFQTLYPFFLLLGEPF